MNRRLAKQIIYGIGYLTAFSLVVFIIYLLWFKPAPSCFDNRQNQGELGVDCGGPCPPCELKTLIPLQSSWIKYFPVNQQTALVVEVKNSNLNWGADHFNYTFDIYGENGVKIKSLTKNSFIYSGEIKYLFELTEINAKDIKDVKIFFSDIKWRSAKEFPKPNVQTREVKTESTTLDRSGVIISGIITNNNAFGLSKVKIIGFLFNQNDVQISVSKTELENIKAFEEKFFKINFPRNITLITQLATQPISPYNFNRDLTIGSKGKDVKNLQEFLKEQGFFKNESTEYFDQPTKEALIQFQKKSGIVPASGYLGPKTRTYINSLIISPKSPLPTINLTEADPAKTKIYVEVLR